MLPPPLDSRATLAAAVWRNFGIVRVYLSGELCLAAPGGLVRSERFPGRQGRLAFAYLVTEHDRSVTRDELTELLWPHEAPRAYEVGLSAVMSKLRALLRTVGIGSLETAPRGYRLNLPPEAWIDVDSAAESVHQAEAALRSGTYKDAYGPAVVACAILRRPFLLGDDGAWIDDQRARLLRLRLRALDCLVDIHWWNREPALALRAAEESVELEPYRETSYRALMRFHDQAGNPAEAMRVYARLERLLADDLGTNPAPETIALKDQLTARASGRGGP